MLSRKISLALTATMIAAAGCASAPNEIESSAVADVIAENQIIPATRAERDAADQTDILTQAAFWGREFDNNPGDKEAGLKLARTLRAMGNPNRAAEVASQSLNLHPGDVELVLVYAQASLDAGRPQDAVSPLARIEGQTATDWRANSIMGVTLDQMGRHADAQAYYVRALKLQPDDARIMSNLGLSYALAGDSKRAEETLRTAVTLPGADARVSQNLALVLGVQGKFDEADAAVSDDLPPGVAQSNRTYFKTLLTPSRTWDSLRTDEN